MMTATRRKVLIAANPRESTGNLTKAREYGLPIVSEAEFWAEVGIAPDVLAQPGGRWARSYTVW
jgi:hypothetical protein